MKNDNIIKVRGLYMKGELRQKLITIPKTLNIEVGDFIEIRKKEVI